jgi:hypothetical protein
MWIGFQSRGAIGTRKHQRNLISTHLDSLHEERLYQSLTEAHEATKLEKKAPPSTFSKKYKN